MKYMLCIFCSVMIGISLLHALRDQGFDFESLVLGHAIGVLQAAIIMTVVCLWAMGEKP